MTDDRKFLILKAGSFAPISSAFVDAFGDTEHTFLNGAGLSADEAIVIDIQAGETPPPPGKDIAGVMVSGSAAMVSTQEDWMLNTGAWLRDAVSHDLPVLGVCFGHQLLAHALGGRVGRNPQGAEGGTIEVRFDDNADPLFADLPRTVDFQAHHYETVLEPPAGSRVLASSAADRHQALRHAPRAWSVQFHPELTMPMMHLLMNRLATPDDEHGHAEMRDTLRPSPHGPQLLRRFVRLARGF